MERCLISICIPAYEKELALQRLLESICRQQFTSFEVIITDDSSSDTIEKLVSLYKDRLELRYYRNNPPAGIGNNWNAGIEKAIAPWIKIMHDDDWFADEYALEKFAEAIQTTEASFIFSGACIHTTSNSIRNHLLEAGNKKMLDDSSLSLLYHNSIGHPSVTMYRKDESLVFDKQFKWVIDVDFYIRYLQRHGNQFGYINEQLINVTNDDNQVSAGCYKNPFVEIPEYLNLLAKFSPRLHFQNKYAFYCLWELVRKFSITLPHDLARYGFNGPVPEKLLTIIDYQKRIPRIVLKQTLWNRWLMNLFFSSYKSK